MIYQTIYKRTSTGAIQEWRMETQGSKYRSISGQVGGKKITSAWTQAVGKNVGRSNETTPEQQAELEVQSAYTHKLERGYVKDVNDVDNVKVVPFKPMLAKKYQDYLKKGRVDFENTFVYSQPKLDGVRAHTTSDELLSRTGKILPCVQWLVDILQPVFEEFGDTIRLDGELYNHDLKDDFNSLISLVKKGKPTSADIEASKKIEYWLYDVADTDLDTGDRIELLYDIQTFIEANNISNIRVVPTHKVESEDEADELFAEYLEDGFEGQMIRVQGPYENKRSSLLLKRKEFMDDEFEITDIQSGKGKRADMAARVCCLTHEGKAFSAGIIGGEDYCRKLLEDKDKYIGQVSTVVFFNYTPDGIPRFPKAKAVYDSPRDI